MLFIESGEVGRIDYDDKAISSLLNRSRSQANEVQEDEDKMFANEYLASFKVGTREQWSRATTHFIVVCCVTKPSSRIEAWFKLGRVAALVRSRFIGQQNKQ